jgi:adenylate cyclase
VLAIDHGTIASLQGASPDITHPKPGKNDGKGPAILFADVSKSMLLHDKLGDEKARAVIDRLLLIATAAIREHDGRIVKTIGDEVLAILPTADAAARAARDLLAEVDKCKAHEGLKPGMHIGFHAGSFIEKSGDVFGDAVNVASRLTDYAQAGQILTTTASAGGISPLVRRAMRKLGPLDIKGRSEEIQVEEIAWREAEDGDTTITEAVLQAPDTSLRLILNLGKDLWTVGPRQRHLSVGRDPEADIAIGNTEASRNHGLVEFRNGGFFYTDMSLNGSYVTFGSTGETLVRRAEVVLSGRGVICFGHSAEEIGERLEFQVQAAGH